MSSGLAWHPRHPDRQRPSRREDVVVQYSEPSPSTYEDEAEVLPAEVAAVEREFADASTRRAEVEAALVDELVDEVLQVPKKDRLRVAWPTGPSPATVTSAPPPQERWDPNQTRGRRN